MNPILTVLVTFSSGQLSTSSVVLEIGLALGVNHPEPVGSFAYKFRIKADDLPDLFARLEHLVGAHSTATAHVLVGEEIAVSPSPEAASLWIHPERNDQ